MSRRDLGLGSVFGAPVVVAILSLIGLVGALLADGAWDRAGPALLATSIGAAAWARFRAGRQAPQTARRGASGPGAAPLRRPISRRRGT